MVDHIMVDAGSRHKLPWGVYDLVIAKRLGDWPAAHAACVCSGTQQTQQHLLLSLLPLQLGMYDCHYR